MTAAEAVPRNDDLVDAGHPADGPRQRYSKDEEAVVVAHLPLVRSIARRYATGRLDPEDLEQQGVLGLLEALPRYDASQGTFGSYARYWVLQSIHRYSAANSHGGYRIPERVWNDANSAKRLEQGLTQRLGHSPTNRELAGEKARQGHVVDPKQIRSLIALMDEPVSLNQPVGEGDQEFGENVSNDQVEVSDRLVRMDMRHRIDVATSELTEHERWCLWHHFGLDGGEGLTYAELSELRPASRSDGTRSASREAIRQTVQRALAKLRSPHSALRS